MPNWCECTLTVTGPREEVARFTAAVRLGDPHDESGGTGILASLYPIPPELQALPAGGLELGYQVQYTDYWQRMATWEWVVKQNGGQVPTTREEVFATLAPDAQAAADRYKANVDRYGFHSWYEWCLARWGSKWGDCHTRLVAEEPRANLQTRLTFEFESPWSPPTAGLTEVSRQFPTLRLRLRYWEGGMGFQGAATFHRGVMTADTIRDYRGSRGG